MEGWVIWDTSVLQGPAEGGASPASPQQAWPFCHSWGERETEIKRTRWHQLPRTLGDSSCPSSLGWHQALLGCGCIALISTQAPRVPSTPCLLPSLDLGPTWKIQVSSKSFLISEILSFLIRWPSQSQGLEADIPVPPSSSSPSLWVLTLRELWPSCVMGRKRKHYSLVTLHPFLKLPVALSEVWTATSISDLPHTFFPYSQFKAICCDNVSSTENCSDKDAAFRSLSISCLPFK